MQLIEILAETRAPDGTDIKLTRRGNELIILVDGKTLMSSRMHGSEAALATFACKGIQTLETPTILVGGLGMGFTLRATLDLLPSDATVVVAELLEAIVEWNRGPIGPLAGHPLKDSRVRVEIGDVAMILRSAANRFDAILLDIDNGPSAFTVADNARLYDHRGLAEVYAALKAGGVLAVWSAREDRKFEQRLRYVGFQVVVERVRGRLKKGGPHHFIFLGYKRG